MVQLNCLSFHLFYRNEPDKVLLACKIFTDKLREEGLLSSFFFIRYSKGGPHIRLRFFGQDACEDILISRLQGWVSKEDAILRADHVVFVPEVERYGGATCVTPSIGLFAASSEVVLQWLERVYPANTARKIGQAIKLHLVFLHAMDCDLTDMCVILEGFIAEWLPMACLALGMDAGEGRRLLVLFRAQSQARQATLRQLYTDMSVQLKQHCFDETVLQDYFTATKNWSASFRRLKGERRASVMSSFLHMTNNRLGLSNYDEPFVAFLLLNMLKDA